MKKILLVDDEPNIIMALEYSFKKKNYEVFIARDGSEAIEIMNHNIPDLIILDIMMPNVDGYETLEYIKRSDHLQHLKVIILSAKNKESDIQKGLDLGADKYLLKPFSIKNLTEEVQQLIS